MPDAFDPQTPPPPTPPGPPPGPPPLANARPGNPWERRDEHGFLAALIENVKLFATSPKEAFQQTREGGDFVSPLLFAVIVGWVMAIIGQIWQLAFSGSMLAMLPAEYSEQLGPMLAGTGGGFIVSIIFAPIGVVIGLFLWSGLLHLTSMLVGALGGSKAGFEGTFRVVSYSSVAQLGQAIPVVGGLIAFVWMTILLVMGLSDLHDTTQGKALAAVLLPVVVCCVCLIAIVVLAVGGGVLASGAGG